MIFLFFISQFLVIYFAYNLGHFLGTKKAVDILKDFHKQHDEWFEKEVNKLKNKAVEEFYKELRAEYNLLYGIKKNPPPESDGTPESTRR